MGQKCITRTLFETMIPRCGIYSKIWFGQMFFVVLESWMCINLSLFFCFFFVVLESWMCINLSLFSVSSIIEVARD